MRVADEELRVETVASLAERFGLTREAVVREVVQGRLPYVNVGGHWRFREKDIAYWIERHAPDTEACQAARLRLVHGERSA